MAPHDALGHPRRATSVDDVQVVAGPRPETPLLGPLPERGLVLDRLLIGNGVHAVLDHDERLKGFETFRRLVDHGKKAPLCDHAFEVGVVDHVAHFGTHKAVVDVDPDCADLEERQNRFDELVPIE